jgi:hypothetical protein
MSFLQSMPSTNKLVRMLEPEMGVFIPVDDGLLIESRGKLPLGTKIFPYMGGAGFFMLGHMFL